MSNDPFKGRRPTALEEEAYATAKLQFAGQWRQFTASRDAIQRLDERLMATAQEVSRNTLRPSRGDSIVTADTGPLRRCADLTENTCICHRPTTGGGEFIVVESLPLKSGELRSVLARSRDAAGALKVFISDQRAALRLWATDVSAQVREYLLEKYPAEDLRVVAEAVSGRFTPVCQRTGESGTTRRRGRGIRN